MKTHNREKCSQCDYACSDPSDLKTHLKLQSGQKPNKCSQCDYASSKTGNLSMPLIMQAICGIIWKHTLEKNQTNATNVTFSGTSGDRKYAGQRKYIGRTLLPPTQRSQSTPEQGNPRRLWLRSRDVTVRSRRFQNSDHCLLRRLQKHPSSRSPHSSPRRLPNQFKKTVKTRRRVL